MCRALLFHPFRPGLQQVFKSLLEKIRLSRPFPPPQPYEPLCVVGDLHGCFSIFQRLLDKIPEDHRIVLVGDYIDRGEESAELLRFIAERHDFTCLKGNHEDMLLRFLDDPAERGARWLRYGGLQTLASFGIQGGREQMDAEALEDCSSRLKAAMGNQLIEWIRNLELSVVSGNLLITHAGADPNRPEYGQTEQDLMWGHPDFSRQKRTDGIWVAHGHTIQETPTASHGRIGVDTGAYASGVLSAACIANGDITFIQSHC